MCHLMKLLKFFLAHSMKYIWYSPQNSKYTLFIFSSNCTLQILALQTCNQDFSKKTITASCFKRGQLKEDN